MEKNYKRIEKNVNGIEYVYLDGRVRAGLYTHLYMNLNTGEFVVAVNVNTTSKGIEWGQGHYTRDLETALKIFQERVGE